MIRDHQLNAILNSRGHFAFALGAGAEPELPRGPEYDAQGRWDYLYPDQSPRSRMMQNVNGSTWSP